MLSVKSSQTFMGLCVAALLSASTSGLPRVSGAVTFLNHFNTPYVYTPPVVGNGAGAADFAVGNPQQLIPPPSGPGGAIVPGGKFGNGLNHAVGGRIEYATAGNFNVNKGTIEMWVKGSDPNGVGNGVTGPDFQFRGLWGSDNCSGTGDLRLYIYNDQQNDFMRSLGAYMVVPGSPPSYHWEIERPIPVDKLDDSNWHHVVWEFNTTPGQEATALWWDGVLLGNTVDDGFTITPIPTFTSTRMHVGEVQCGSAPWPGMIDEMRISDNLVYDVNSDFTPPTSPFPTPAPNVAGDYDNDADVDGADLLAWQRGLGSAIAPPGTDPDGSGNGTVDAADLTVWRNNFGFGAGTAVVAAAPEPTSLALVGLIVASLPILRGRRR